MKCSSRRGLVGLTVVVGLVAMGCNKKKDEAKSDDKTAETKTGQVAITTNPLADATYPEGMNVTAFPQEKVELTQTGNVAVPTNSNSGLRQLLLADPQPQGPNNQSCNLKYESDASGVITKNPDYQEPAQPASLTADNSPNPPNPPAALDPTDACNANQPKTEADVVKAPKAKLDQEADLLAGTAQECLPSTTIQAIANSVPVNNDACFQNDYGLLSGTACSENKEACLVNVARSTVSDGTAQIEGGLGIMQSMLCQAKKDGKAETLPAIGESIDLAASLQASVAGRDDAPTITAAKITRLADVDSKAVYRTTLTFTTKATSPQGKASQEAKSVEFNLVHSPSATAGEYAGLMWIKRAKESAAPNDKPELTSVRYSRMGSGTSARLKMDVIRADMKGDVPFTSEGVINFPTESLAGDNSTLQSIFRYAFDVNPESSEGQLAVWANPGANLTERARGFIFDLAYDAESRTIKGCGIAGADASSIRQSSVTGKAMKPEGLYTPQVCQAKGNAGPADNFAPYVWKQCFTQGEDGVYSIDTAKTADTRGYDFLPIAEAGITAPDLGFTGSFGEVNK